MQYNHTPVTLFPQKDASTFSCYVGFSFVFISLGGNMIFMQCVSYDARVSLQASWLAIILQ